MRSCVHGHFQAVSRTVSQSLTHGNVDGMFRFRFARDLICGGNSAAACRKFRFPPGAFPGEPGAWSPVPSAPARPVSDVSGTFGARARSHCTIMRAGDVTERSDRITHAVRLRPSRGIDHSSSTRPFFVTSPPLLPRLPWRANNCTAVAFSGTLARPRPAIRTQTATSRFSGFSERIPFPLAAGNVTTNMYTCCAPAARAHCHEYRSVERTCARAEKRTRWPNSGRRGIGPADEK